MYVRLDRARRTIAVILGAVTLVCVGMLLAWDINPTLFPRSAHIILDGFSLALIALAYIIYQSAHRPQPMEWVKAIILAIAFLSWSANQFWPDLRHGIVFNDIAIALFVLDVFLVIVGWPVTSPDESFAETYAESRGLPIHHDQPN